MEVVKRSSVAGPYSKQRIPFEANTESPIRETAVMDQVDTHTIDDTDELRFSVAAK
jgi:hypothetical protein